MRLRDLCGGCCGHRFSLFDLRSAACDGRFGLRQLCLQAFNLDLGIGGIETQQDVARLNRLVVLHRNFNHHSRDTG